MSSISTSSTLVFSDHMPGPKSEKIPALTSEHIPSSDHYPFTNTITLQISTRGIPLVGLPLPPSNLTTQVYTSTNALAYTSTRATRRSGSCMLSSPDAGDLIATTYRFGPGRPPVLRILDKASADAGDEQEAAGAADDENEQREIQIHGTWTNHSQHFFLTAARHGGEAVEWRYVTDADPATGGKQRLLVLIHRATGRRVAQLVRTAATRTAGSGRCSAGNGGLLMMDAEVSAMVGEALIVATCLMMLKKEVDRRRCLQAWVLSAAISGGS